MAAEANGRTTTAPFGVAVVKPSDHADSLPTHAPPRTTGSMPIPPSITATRSGPVSAPRTTRSVSTGQTALVRIDHLADAISSDTKALRRSLPDVASDALALCTGSKADANSMELTLSRDPFISAQVISIANSAMFAPRMPIHGVREAVVRIGLDAVRDVVLMVVTNSTMYRVRGFEARVEQMRRRTLAAAAAARLLAKELRAESEYGFLAGLLHDIGELVLLERCVQEGILVPGMLEDPVDGSALRERLDAHHTRIGGALCRAWKLPPGVVEAAEYHHEYRVEGKTRFPAHLCAAADAIARNVMPGAHPSLAAEAAPVLELGLPTDQVSAIVQHVAAALPMLVAAGSAAAGHTTITPTSR
jgi:putative nucleotidyltransferase with HDIG domain